MPKSGAKDSDHDGHRERLRERFLKGGSDALADYELLELALFYTKPQGDMKPIAKALLKKFGGFSGVLSAPEQLLREIPGVGEKTAVHLKVLLAIARQLGREDVKDRVALDSWAALIDYCRAQMAFESREQFRILFLDKRNRLIADEVQQVGTVDHTPVYPREVIKRALELSSTALILVHNHPSGDPSPSEADVSMTKSVADIARPLGIVVHDHIIVGRDGHASMRALKLF